MATATKKTPIPKKAKAPKKVAAKKAKAPKVWVPPVMDLTLTLESIGAKIGDKVMLGPGLHEIISFDASQQEQVQMKCLEKGDTGGTVRRGLYTVSINLVKNNKK